MEIVIIFLRYLALSLMNTSAEDNNYPFVVRVFGTWHNDTANAICFNHCFKVSVIINWYQL